MNRLFPDVYFAYTQFMAYDPDFGPPGCDWTDAHFGQGFARREGVIAVRTILEFGFAELLVGVGEPFEWTNYDRVLAVPLRIVSGRVMVRGPEEWPCERIVAVPSGTYRVTIAQRVIGEEREQVAINFELSPPAPQFSEILRADENLDPPPRLLETVGKV